VSAKQFWGRAAQRRRLWLGGVRGAFFFGSTPRLGLLGCIAVVAAGDNPTLVSWGNTLKYAEINADPATVRDHAQELREQALANDVAKDVDIAKLPHEPC
jgi:hypothetical protein